MRNLNKSQTTKLLRFASVFLIVGLFSISNIFGQLNQEQYNFSDSEELSSYDVKSFTVQEVNNKAYFKFLIVEGDDNTSYTLETSMNGIDFSPINIKEGFKSPNNTPLLYCFTVNKENNTNGSYYRIKRTSILDEVYSNVVSVEDSYQEFAFQKN